MPSARWNRPAASSSPRSTIPIAGWPPSPPPPPPSVTCVATVVRPPRVVSPPQVVAIRPRVAVGIAIVGRRAVAVARVRGIAVAVVRVRVIGACNRAGDERAGEKAAQCSRTPPSPAGLRRAGRGNCRDCDGGGRGESGQSFPHVHLRVTPRPKRETCWNGSAGSCFHLAVHRLTLEAPT